MRMLEKAMNFIYMCLALISLFFFFSWARVQMQADSGVGVNIFLVNIFGAAALVLVGVYFGVRAKKIDKKFKHVVDDENDLKKIGVSDIKFQNTMGVICSILMGGALTDWILHSKISIASSFSTALFLFIYASFAYKSGYRDGYLVDKSLLKLTLFYVLPMAFVICILIYRIITMVNNAN